MHINIYMKCILFMYVFIIYIYVYSFGYVSSSRECSARSAPSIMPRSASMTISSSEFVDASLPPLYSRCRS